MHNRSVTVPYGSWGIVICRTSVIDDSYGEGLVILIRGTMITLRYNLMRLMGRLKDA